MGLLVPKATQKKRLIGFNQQDNQEQTIKQANKQLKINRDKEKESVCVIIYSSLTQICNLCPLFKVSPSKIQLHYHFLFFTK